jgi:hypothetical protein
MAISVFYTFPPPFPADSAGRQGIQIDNATSDSDARAQALAIVQSRKAQADAVSASLANAQTFLTT